MTWLAIMLKPLIAFVVLACLCLPARMAVKRWVPDGRIKRILLHPITRD